MADQTTPSARSERYRNAVPRRVVRLKAANDNHLPPMRKMRWLAAILALGAAVGLWKWANW